MEVTRKQSTPNFPKNEHFLPPDTHTYVRVLVDKKCSLFGKFGVLCFLVTSVLRFGLLPHFRRNVKLKFEKHSPQIENCTEATLFFISNCSQVSALKVAYLFKVFGAQNCLMVA